jgi:hypothetical protein
MIAMQPFEHYNACFADPGTVAETFVLRKVAFASLCEQNNSLLIGPRGSGKTTLLKMLKVSAQIKWKNKRQSMFLRRFTFAPIYVGADKLFDLVIGNYHVAAFDENTFELLAKCLLSFRIKFACLHTARELGDPKLENAENLSHQYERLDVSVEAQIAKELSVAWNLGDQAFSLLEVRSQLRGQLAEVNRFVDRIKFGQGVTVRELLDYNQCNYSPLCGGVTRV